MHGCQYRDLSVVSALILAQWILGISKAIPAQTTQAVARSIYKAASGYGGPADIVRLINELMDLCKVASESELSIVAPNADVNTD